MTSKNIKQICITNKHLELSLVVNLQRSGRPRRVRNLAVVSALAARIRINPVRNQNIMTREMKKNITPYTQKRY